MFFDIKSTKKIPDQITRHSVAAELYLQPIARLIRPLSRPQSGVKFAASLKSQESLSSTITSSSLPSLTSRPEATPTASTKPPLPPRAPSNSTALSAPTLPPVIPRLTFRNISSSENDENKTKVPMISRSI